MTFKNVALILAFIVALAFLVAGGWQYAEAQQARHTLLDTEKELLDEVGRQITELELHPADSALTYYSYFIGITLIERKYNLVLLRISTAESSAAKNFALGAFLLAAVGCIEAFKEWFQRGGQRSQAGIDAKQNTIEGGSMRAIVSVSDKSGLVDFVRKLKDLDVEIFSTGGTKKAIEVEGIKVHSISELTGFPEILDGRVKTLHPAVHGGILARRELPQHMDELAKNKIQTIDMVVVNLYPFVQTVTKANVSLEEALENIDIGGPTMIRAAAKNFPSVLVIVDPEDYDAVIEKLRQGKVDQKERKRLAQKAFQHVAMYDTAIAQYLRDEETFPQDMTIAMKKLYDLRYGENPHQKAALYTEQSIRQKPAGMTSVKLLSGPELSFNNFLDLEAAWSTACDFTDPTIAIIKHNNACGLCSNKDLIEAYKRALAGDPVSAFGGIVACNRPIDLALATEIDKTHYDCIIAPSYSDEALEIFKRKKNMRLLSLPLLQHQGKTGNIDLRPISGGFLVQEQDYYTEEEFKPKTVSKREPTKAEMRDLLFAWKAVKHIKSNGIVLAKDNTLLGMGTGQPNRVVSVELSLKRAGDAAKGSVLASDAMIPFPDTVEVAAQGGVTAVIQTGGSVRDKEVIATADKYNMAMVLTGIRHFKH